jgi:uncharacterized protein (DUF2236 family)
MDYRDNTLDPVRTWVATHVRRAVTGHNGAVRHRDLFRSGGERWFDDDAVIRRVHADSAMFVGGLRALLLQSLHPLAMAGVAEHSDYRADPWHRLQRTADFLAATTYGPTAEAERAVARVHAVHEHIVGVAPDGRPYAANDPHLLRWVHVAEVDSFLRAHLAYGRHPLGAAGRDEYVAQTGVVARKLGVLDPPETEAELADRLAAFRPELASTPHAREAVRYVVRKPPLPLAARPAYGVLIAAAVGLLPHWSRQPLGLPWLPRTERTVVRTGGTLATGTIRWAMAPGRAVARDLATARAEG